MPNISGFNVFSENPLIQRGTDGLDFQKWRSFTSSGSSVDKRTFERDFPIQIIPSTDLLVKADVNVGPSSMERDMDGLRIINNFLAGRDNIDQCGEETADNNMEVSCGGGWYGQGCVESDTMGLLTYQETEVNAGHLYSGKNLIQWGC
uniref:Uncharacterized protein n=1 Tax=Cacopsylla melanoneura TaxID=428564 RepID=A0A8D8TTQ0_9HEMI